VTSPDDLASSVFVMTPDDEAGRWTPFNAPDGQVLGSVAALFDTDAEASVTPVVWTCEPMTWQSPFEADEVFHVLGGHARVVDAEGRAYELTPGISISFPRGLVARWTVLEALRAFVVVIPP
jgi:uncharacterized cupin superfamily protein